jgi:hypothetical protein
MVCSVCGGASCTSVAASCVVVVVLDGVCVVIDTCAGVCTLAHALIDWWCWRRGVMCDSAWPRGCYATHARASLLSCCAVMSIDEVATVSIAASCVLLSL